MTYEQVKSALKNVTYGDAMKTYSEMRNSFIKQYAKAIGDTTGKVATQYINDFINTINTENFQGQSFGLSNDLAARLESAVEAAMDRADLSQFSYLVTDSEKSYHELTKKAIRDLQLHLNTIFDLNLLHAELEQSLAQMKVSKTDAGLNTDDILTWMKSYVTSKFYNKLRGKSSTYGRRTVLAGYFEEALTHKATGQLSKHLSQAMGSMQVGSTKIASSRGTIDSVFDEYFNFLSADLDADFRASVNLDDNTLTNGFGAQVKLWNPPWKLKKPPKTRSIASNINLYNQWQDKTSWIRGVQFLQSRVREAMGDNVMYILGNSFYWTVDLIHDFKEHEYYLAFHHDGKQFTQTVAWEQIDMSKPYDT